MPPLWLMMVQCQSGTHLCAFSGCTGMANRKDTCILILTLVLEVSPI